MIAELLERGNLRANRERFPRKSSPLCAALDHRSPRARRLKTDEQDQVPWIGQPLSQVMLNAPPVTMPLEEMMIEGMALIDFLRLLRGRGEGETRPLQRRSIL